ncbi:MAG: hypothetical protein ACFE8B_05785 [Candidatus Hermodarchaeota archaeon]
MVQVYVKKKNLEEPFKIAELIVLKELPAKKEDYEVVRLKAAEIPIKKALLKLIKKAKYNAKYLEERIPVSNVKRNIHYRNTGLF